MMGFFPRIFLALVILLPTSSSDAAGRRSPGAAFEPMASVASVMPQVEKLGDRYRMTVPTPDSLPHYLIEKSDKKIWLRLVRPTNDESQILEGDSVIREVRLVQRPYSADVIVKLGDDAVSNDVYFDEGKKKIVVDVFTSERVNRAIAARAPEVAVNEPPVLRTKKQARRENKSFAARKAAPVTPVLTAAKPTVITAADPSRREPAFTKKKDETVVVIDAGHGGMDSGAIGTRGTLEKDINLAFAKALAKTLSAEKNFRVIMTRTDDEFIALGERTRIANEANADFFVSIHCNSSLSPKNIGFETYFLSPEATDKAAAAVARLENSVVALETSSKGKPSSRLNEVLASMAIGSFINESSKFASLLCRNVRNHTSEDKASVKEADFFVLRGAQMPAILVELEYLSNPVSEFKLRSSRYRAQLVKGVTEGIKSYERQARQEREAMASQVTREALTETAR